MIPMATIDTNKFKVSCAKCGSSEIAAVHQKGSAYGASWQNGPALKYFEAVWTDEKFTGPVIARAVCRTCGDQARVESIG
jgi:hypothetical protein